MRRSPPALPSVLAGALAALAFSTPANAQFNLAWQKCIAFAGQHANENSTCDGSRPDPYLLILSFIPPSPMPSFTGFRAVIGLATDAPQVPDYWKLGAGECRESAVHFPVPLSGLAGACQDPWVGAVVSGGWSWISGTPSPDEARVTFVETRDVPRSLVMGQQYAASGISIDAPSGSELCFGCDIPICLEVIEVDLYQSDAAPIVLTTAGTRKIVTWQGGPPRLGCLTYVPDPVRNRTWGSIKGMYR
jgi:hypothetical protein